MRTTHTIELYKGKRGWYIRIVARNGKIVADGGEAYANYSNALRAATRLRANLLFSEIVKK